MSERTTFHYWSDTTVCDPFLECRKEATLEKTPLDIDDLLYLAGAALDAAGVAYHDLELEADALSYGTTSIIHRLHLETARGREEHVVRVQPLTPIEKKRHHYSIVERIVQRRCAEAGIHKYHSRFTVR